MPALLTGATGYLGGYLLAELLARGEERVHVLVRASTRDDAARRLWRALQPHLPWDAFRDALQARISIWLGDLTERGLGVGPGLAGEIDSILHCAATLNRKSERSCLEVNLKGTLETIQLARRVPRLRRFTYVSTVAVAGERQDETVFEDSAIDWKRRDYDPYARTKKFGEHMVRELLPDTSRVVVRPSVVLGDSRRDFITQFDMVKAFAFLARLPVLPLRPKDRIDVVPVDWVASAIASLHLADAPRHETYHLSSGEDSPAFAELTDALAAARGKRRPLYAPWLAGPFAASVRVLARLRGTGIGRAAARMEVFWPYLRFNTVFDNRRAVDELGRKPARFPEYCAPLLRFALEHRFAYPYREWPA